MTNEECALEAVKFVKANQRELIERSVGSVKPTAKPVSIFMAGSPGAGKTEFSIRLIEELLGARDKIVRIDPDEIRAWLPQYIPGKAELFQEAISTGVNKIHDYVKSKSISFLLDGTFSDLEQAQKNVQQSLDKKRMVRIQYVVQPPAVAWRFTQEREKVDGRNIRREDFIRHFLAARDTVAHIKKRFGKKVQVDIIERDVEKNTYTTQLNVDNLDKYLPKKYSEIELNNLI
ncbi:MAG: zeta toxin family protein [Candidatus Pacebacteria bacterium]|nr:zeta toxin family protein [Candidatus Paceibacterota bacterium]